MLKNSTLRDMSQKEVSYEEFLLELRRLNRKGLDLYIGTDSQVIKNKICIVTCICFYKHGIPENQIFYIKNRVDSNKYPTLRSRIIFEAYKSLEMALELDPMIKGRLTVHLDIGTDFKRNKTAKFNNELEILFKSQGFGCEVKPNSWASSCIADKFTKN